MAKTQGATERSKPVFIIWKDAYSVGHDELDGQHKIIVSIINDLYVAIQSGTEHEVLGGILHRLSDYTKLHFRREEHLMEAHGFAHTAEHGILHQRMVETTEDLRRQVSRSGGGEASEVLAFLKDWWLNHICRADQEYSSVMRGAGES